MTGIVIVSHSAKLAEGVGDIINMMAPEVLVSLAGGNDDGSYGVSISKVREALRQMRPAKHALIFLDLGSSVSIVKDILGEFQKGKFVLMDTPLVEGAVSAAVVAAGDPPLQDIIRIAKETRNQFKF